MSSPLEGTPVRSQGRRRVLWAALAVGGILPSIGCQVEYAGMTLPSGKYMYDDVQYFPPGPEFRWANTQAATQRARMSAMGEAAGVGAMPGAPGVGPIVTPPPAPGAIPPQQNLLGNPTDVNVSPFAVEPPVPAAPAPGIPPQGGGAIPPPMMPGGGMEAPPDFGPR